MSHSSASTARRSLFAHSLWMGLGGCLFVLLSGIPGSKAARDTSLPASATRLELLVIEVENCAICTHVRTHIQPAYNLTPRAREIPLRYVDVTRRDELELGLTSRIQTVPTIVLLRDGREVDRIVGYTGPEIFFHALDAMIQRIN